MELFFDYFKFIFLRVSFEILKTILQNLIFLREITTF